MGISKMVVAKSDYKAPAILDMCYRYNVQEPIPALFSTITAMQVLVGVYNNVEAPYSPTNNIRCYR